MGRVSAGGELRDLRPCLGEHRMCAHEPDLEFQKEKFARSRALLKHAAKNVGVALGLAWTPFGGEVLVIETVLSEGAGKLNLTGKLGDVIKESVQVAMSFLRSRAADYGLDFGQLKTVSGGAECEAVGLVSLLCPN